MDAVAIELGGEIGAVVQDESDPAGLRDRLQDARRAADRGVVRILETQLQAGDIAARKRENEILRKPLGIELGRGDEVEPGCGPALFCERDQSCPR
jgi:hypothetical protein